MAKQMTKGTIQEEPSFHSLAEEPILGTGELVVDTKRMNAPQRPILKTPDTSHDNSYAGNKHPNREVSFDSITVRKYPMELGDHPSCTIGAPVSLAWEYDEEDPVDLDIYECERGRRRRLRHLVLSYYRRQDILRNAGYSDEDIRKAARSVSKTQRQRSRTRFFNPVSKLEDIACSAGRKMKRLVSSKNDAEKK